MSSFYSIIVPFVGRFYCWKPFEIAVNGLLEIIFLVSDSTLFSMRECFFIYLCVCVDFSLIWFDRPNKMRLLYTRNSLIKFINKVERRKNTHTKHSEIQTHKLNDEQRKPSTYYSTFPIAFLPSPSPPCLCSHVRLHIEPKEANKMRRIMMFLVLFYFIARI